MKLRSKKAQVTLFLILGIVILMGASIYLYSTSITKQEIQVPIEKVEGANLQIKPITHLVESCIKKIGIDGFKKIGEHGGYLELNNPAFSTRVFKTKAKSYESDALLIDGSSVAVPYWWYLRPPKTCVTCNLDSGRPSLNEISSQINKYVELNFASCINNFEVFKERGFEITAGNAEVLTAINEKDVDIILTYPLTITNEGGKSEVNEFRVNLDLNFYEIYLAARQIMVMEREEQFLENVLMHLLSVYSPAPGPNTLPPLSWVDYTSTPYEWQMADVDMLLRNELLASHIPLIQIENTKDAIQITSNDSIQQGVYNVMFLRSGVDMSRFNVNFLYNPEWPIHLDITPNKDGKKIKPRVEKTAFPFGTSPSYETNYYEFYYDIAYPVLVMIYDPSSLVKNNELGYTFMFALEGNIRDNKNLLEWNLGEGTIGARDPSDVAINLQIPKQTTVDCVASGTDTFVCPLTKKRYVLGKHANNLESLNYTCNSNCVKTEKTGQNVNSTSKKLFCDENQRISGKVKITVTDSKSGSLSDVKITHGCGNYASCGIPSTNENGVIETRLPICIGSGHFTFEKEGYRLKVLSDITTEFDVDQELEVQLDKYVSKNITLKYVYLDDIGAGKALRPRNLLNNHRAMFFITPKKKGETLPIASVNFDNANEQEIQLLPGEYDVDILLRDIKGFTVSMQAGPGATKNVKMAQAIVGKLGFNNETGYLKIDQSKLDSNSKIEFYVINIGKVTSLENLSRLDLIDNITKTFRKKLEPKYVRYEEE